MFTVRRDGFTLAVIITTSLIDASVLIDETYCYQVSGYDKHGFLVAESETGCITVVSTLGSSLQATSMASGPTRVSTSVSPAIGGGSLMMSPAWPPPQPASATTQATEATVRNSVRYARSSHMACRGRLSDRN
ncbi:MAG TPA: hypothetical protein VFR86_05670 [Burkholderiaceae bacterium]|nr:hypothetical protein [Burkholderiaceae bacterium]